MIKIFNKVIWKNNNFGYKWGDFCDRQYKRIYKTVCYSDFGEYVVLNEDEPDLTKKYNVIYDNKNYKQGYVKLCVEHHTDYWFFWQFYNYFELKFWTFLNGFGHHWFETDLKRLLKTI